jgi:GR25 family glycosyltransferase involved in LPS biosynthesis
MTSFFLLAIIILFLLLSLYILFNDFFKKGSTQLDKIYYINLDRRPDRKAHFLKQCQNEKINMDLVERFVAIDGDHLALSEEEEMMFANSDFKNKDNRKYLIGNQLSHFYILKEMIRKKYDYILVLQDDVIFKNNFNFYLSRVLKSIPGDAEIVNIGKHKIAYYAYFWPLDLEIGKEDLNHCKKQVSNAICELKENENPCSLAYIVTKKGAKNLVKYFKENGFHKATDLNYNEYLREKDINYASSIVLCTGELMGSDIFV